MVGLTAGHCCAHPDEVITCSDFRLSAWVKLTAVTNFSHSGRHCELYKDPCININCQNGGTCDSEGLNATCICAPGYAGKLICILHRMSVFAVSKTNTM